MTDQVDPPVEPTPPQPDDTPPASTPPDPPPSDSPPEPMVEQKRLTGAIQKIQTLTEEKKRTDQELSASRDRIAELELDLAGKDAEISATVGERDKALEEERKKNEGLEAEKKTLEAKMRKVELAKELGHPELVHIIDTVPTFEDDELQKKALEDILNFTGAQVKKREEELLAGVTPPITPVPDEEVGPSSNKAWKEKVNAEQDPQKRQQLFDKWWEWQQQNPDAAE